MSEAGTALGSEGGRPVFPSEGKGGDVSWGYEVSGDLGEARLHWTESAQGLLTFLLRASEEGYLQKWSIKQIVVEF